MRITLPFAATALLAFALALASPLATAQQPLPADAAAPDAAALTPQATEKKIERIRIEDDATRIDELRYGGETQSITVSPKFGAPEYQVVPRDAARQRLEVGRDNSGIGTSGQRVWKVFGF